MSARRIEAAESLAITDVRTWGEVARGSTFAAASGPSRASPERRAFV
jgi:hypothetical protein